MRRGESLGPGDLAIRGARIVQIGKAGRFACQALSA